MNGGTFHHLKINHLLTINYQLSGIVGIGNAGGGDGGQAGCSFSGAPSAGSPNSGGNQLLSVFFLLLILNRRRRWRSTPMWRRSQRGQWYYNIDY